MVTEDTVSEMPELPDTGIVSNEQVGEEPAQGEPAFSWHQVQAAEGSEVPAQDIGWTWSKKVANPSETSLATERQEEKEKSFALQANLDGAESDAGEYEEVKMDEDEKTEKKRIISLDPRQKEVEEEDVEIKVTMIKELGEEMEEEEDEGEEGGELEKCDVDRGMRVETESEIDVEGEGKGEEEGKKDEDQLEVEFSAGVPIDVPGLPAGVSVVRAPSDDDLGELEDGSRAE